MQNKISTPVVIVEVLKTGRMLIAALTASSIISTVANHRMTMEYNSRWGDFKISPAEIQKSINEEIR